jgi:hypothetical protein
VIACARLYAPVIVLVVWAIVLFIDGRAGGTGIAVVKALWLIALAVAAATAERERSRRRRERRG